MQTIITDNVKETMQTAADDIEIAFICDPFEGENFELLRKEEQRIIGPPIVYACAQQKQPLPYNSRPIYCSVMSNHILCFTGFRKKEELGRLCNLVHHMGGSIRREFSGRVTQLVANSIHGQKYRVSCWFLAKTEILCRSVSFASCKASERQNGINSCEISLL